MKKLLPVLLLAFLFLAVQDIAWAASVDINPVISSSTGQPIGDCVGPDGKHFQATQAVCDTFNKAWGKKTLSFNVGQPSPLPPTTPIAVVIAQAQANGSPLIDCVGPDKKHLSVPQEVCDKLNIDWKKKTPAPIVLSSKNTPSVTLAAVPAQASVQAGPSLDTTIKNSLEKGSPLGDCVGPDKKHFDATKEVCDAFNKNWGKPTQSFAPGKTTGVGIQSAIINSSPSSVSGGNKSSSGSTINSGSKGPSTVSSPKTSNSSKGESKESKRSKESKNK